MLVLCNVVLCTFCLVLPYNIGDQLTITCEIILTLSLYLELEVNKKNEFDNLSVHFLTIHPFLSVHPSIYSSINKLSSIIH